MTDEYETGRSSLEALIKWYEPRKSKRNEATTRLHLVNDLFLKCLGWAKEDCTCEHRCEGEYADYIFSAPRPVLIVEAKKEGSYFEVPAGTTRLEYSLPSLRRDHPELKSAVDQVASYCQSRGVPVPAVCNGHQIVAFIGARIDGQVALEGRAIVFPSLDFALGEFPQFWNLLSKPGIEEKKLQRQLLGDSVPQLPPKLAHNISRYPGVKNRNPFQTDLQIVSDIVIEDVSRSRDMETRFLEECYCKSGALSKYALVSKRILKARYASLFDSDIAGPTAVPATDKKGMSGDLMAESLSRRPIILLGDVGVGKTTFIRFLIKIDAASLFDDAIALYLDLGTQATMAKDIKKFVIKEIETQLKDTYEMNIASDAFVRGVHNLALKDFGDGIWGPLKTSNPGLYKEKEITFLESLVLDKEGHLRKSLNHISKGRQKQVVVFLDNTDQRDEGDQEVAFLIAQELAARWPVTVFVSLRPETFHRSVRVGTLAAYHPKAFTISPPRIEQVIKKRLEFALKLTKGEVPLQLLTKHTTVELASLEGIIKAFLDSLDSNRNLSECIENISNGNVRLGLQLVKEFFGSGHVNTQKIYDLYDRTGSYTVAIHEFLRAIIYRDNVYFDPATSAITNLFDIFHPDDKEHFILPCIVGVVNYLSKPSSDEGFVETKKVYDAIQSLGFTPDQVDVAITRAYKRRLLETVARRIPELGQTMPHSLRVTTTGLYHIEKLCRRFEYVDAMIVDTPVLDAEQRQRINDVAAIGDRLDRAEIFISYLDTQWQKLPGPAHGFDWPSISSELKSHISNIRLRSGAKTAAGPRPPDPS